MANGITSQWEDAHIKLGNYEPRPEIIPESVLNKEGQEKLEERKDLENYLDMKKDEDLDDLEDEFMNDDFFDKYKQSRMDELKQQSKEPQFGSVREISRDQYVAEVTNAPDNTWVVLHLYQPYIEVSNLVNQWLDQLAAKYPLTKFVKIVATRCTEGFPDHCVPTILLYKNTKVAASIYSIDKFMRKFTQQWLERILHEHNVITCKDIFEEEDDIKESINMINNPYKMKKQHQDVFDKMEDREYVNENMNIHRRMN